MTGGELSAVAVDAHKARSTALCIRSRKTARSRADASFHDLPSAQQSGLRKVAGIAHIWLAGNASARIRLGLLTPARLPYVAHTPRL